MAPDLTHTFSVPPQNQSTEVEAQSLAGIEQSVQRAAGMGKIEEVDIRALVDRTDEKWKRLESGEFEQKSTGKVRLGRDGKPRRPPKRRNSEDIRRDQLVEAVLSESKCTISSSSRSASLIRVVDFFDAQAPGPFNTTDSGNNDEAVLAQFQAEYYESIEEARQQQRKPVPTLGVKGAKEAPKGPKLGGSKSVRAKMRLAEEQATKTKR